jgi:hypothetical protein
MPRVDASRILTAMIDVMIIRNISRPAPECSSVSQALARHILATVDLPIAVPIKASDPFDTMSFGVEQCL